MDVPDSASKPPPGTLEMIATPGALTATSGPKQVNLGEKIPPSDTSVGSTVEASQVSSGYWLSLPIADTHSTSGEEAGYLTSSPEFPAATMKATPWVTASRDSTQELTTT